MGRELEQYHMTLSPKSKSAQLVVGPSSSLWLENYSLVFSSSQHEISFLDCDVVFGLMLFPERSASPG